MSFLILAAMVGGRRLDVDQKPGAGANF